MNSSESTTFQGRDSQEADAGADKDGNKLDLTVDNKKAERNVTIFKLLRTAALVFSWVAMGLSLSLPGATMLDLRERLGCDITYEDMSKALSTKSVGIILGGIFYGILHDRFHKQSDVIISTSLFIYGVALLLEPWATKLWMLATLYFIEGFGLGSQDVVGSAMIILTWGENSNAPMHAIQFGYPVGYTLGPLLAYPFISEDSLCHDNANNITENTTIYTTTEHFENVSRIEFTYAIAGAYVLIVSIIFFVFFLVKPPKDFVIQGQTQETLKGVFSPGQCAGGATVFAVAILVLTGTFWFFYVGRIAMMGTYVFSYAVESDLKFDKDEAALVNSVYGFSAVVASAIIIPVSHFAPIVPLFCIEVGLSAIVTACLAFFGTQNKIYFLIFVCLYSGFEVLLYPAGITWLDKYITLTSFIVAILNIFAQLGTIALLNAAGYIFSYKNPDDMMYLAFAIAIFLCIWLIIMQVVASRHGSRYVKDDVIKLASNETAKPETTNGADVYSVNNYVSHITEITEL